MFFLPELIFMGWNKLFSFWKKIIERWNSSLKIKYFITIFFFLIFLSKSDQEICIFGGGCHKIMFVGYNFKISLK
jgi:hypothetical protein